MVFSPINLWFFLHINMIPGPFNLPSTHKILILLESNQVIISSLPQTITMAFLSTAISMGWYGCQSIITTRFIIYVCSWCFKMLGLSFSSNFSNSSRRKYKQRSNQCWRMEWCLFRRGKDRWPYVLVRRRHSMTDKCLVEQLKWSNWWQFKERVTLLEASCRYFCPLAQRKCLWYNFFP